MRIVKLSVSAILIASLFSSLSYAAVQDRISGSLSNGQTVTLKGNVHRKALPQFDQGPVDPAMRMGTITLMTPPNAAQQRALAQLLAKQQDRKSPNYHKWLTPEQYADRFGMSQNDMQRMTSWLKAQGFSMIHPARGRNWISFTGTAAQVQSAFGTEIRRFNVNGELHYANATSPVIPSALGGIVAGVRGLHDFRPRPMGIRRNSGVRPGYNSSVFGPLVAPGDIAAIYDINSLYNAGIDGSGQKLAVMGQTDIYLADISDFRSGFGLSSISCTTNSSDVITSCNDPHFSYVLNPPDPLLSTNGDISEADLDLEWAGAVARGAQVVYVNSSDVFSSFYYAVDNNIAPVISLSYGLCEFGDNFVLSSSGQPLGDEAELQKASSMGITFVNSTGDSGAAECDFGGSTGTLTTTNLATQGLAVSYPASSPEVTGVGGTAIPLANLTSQFWGTTNSTDGASTTSYIPEQVWNDDAEIGEFCVQNPSNTFCTQGGSTAVSGWVPITSALTAQNDIGISSTGGGASNCAIQNSSNTACVSGFPKPSWQTVTVSGQGNVRLTPDVSFLATPNFPGYIFCTQLSELGISGTGSSCASGISNAVDNDQSIIGGTSASAPVFAGIATLLNQYLGASGGLGNVNPTLYQLAGTPSNLAFNPVTTGDNTVYCAGGTPTVQPASYRCPGATGTTGVLGFQASTKDTTTGYNLVAGLGSVNVNNLATAWAASLAPGFSLVPTATSYQVTQGSSIDATVTVALVGGFTGPVTFDCTDPAPESTCTAPNAISATSNVSFHITTAAGTTSGTYSITINGTSGTTTNTTQITLSVTSGGGGTFTLTPTATSFQVSQGSSVDATVAVTLSSGFSGTITFSCTDTASESTCTAPNAISTTSNVSFHITTTAATVATRSTPGHGTQIFYALLLPGLFGVVVTAAPRRSLRGMRFLGLIIILGLSTLWLASCGGGSGGTKDPGTPTGSYTITVSAISGSTTVPASFQLVVQ
jgi:subtilase family serine protease